MKFCPVLIFWKFLSRYAEITHTDIKIQRMNLNNGESQ